MLSFSKTAGYAIAALSCLNGPGGQTVTIKEVAGCTKISSSYLAKIILSLAEKNLVKTKRGYTGGLLLTRPPEEISIRDIVEAVEGPRLMERCLLGLDGYDESCPTHEFWKEEQERIKTELDARHLAEFTCFKNCMLSRRRFIQSIHATSKKARNEDEKENVPQENGRCLC